MGSAPVTVTMATLLVLLLAFVAIGADAQCYPGWIKHGSSCYGIGEENVSWGGAASLCRVFDSNLAEIESSEENDFLKNLALNRSYRALWIGGTDIFSEGQWIWSGSKMPIQEFTDWFPGEPNMADGPSAEDCLQFFAAERMQWNDETCSMTFPFVCEIRLEGEEEVVGR